MTKIKIVGVFALGGLVGCGAAATLSTSFAQPKSGQWGCYDGAEFPDINAAQSTGSAAKLASGMNKIATETPVGTVIWSTWGGGVVCVKH